MKKLTVVIEHISVTGRTLFDSTNKLSITTLVKISCNPKMPSQVCSIESHKASNLLGDFNKMKVFKRRQRDEGQ